MFQQSVGFNPSSVLSGLTKGVSPYGRGMAMQAGAQMGMDRSMQNQKFGLEQMQAHSQQRQQAAGNSAQAAQNATQERTQAGNQAAQYSAFNIGRGYDYMGLMQRPQLRLKQALINGMAGQF